MCSAFFVFKAYRVVVAVGRCLHREATGLRPWWRGLLRAVGLCPFLFVGEGLTLAEIATGTEVPIGTAKSRIFHARRHLKAVLEGDDS